MKKLVKKGDKNSSNEVKIRNPLSLRDIPPAVVGLRLKKGNLFYLFLDNRNKIFP